MTAHELASALDGVKRGKSYWALCPTHERDNRRHRPSLEISEGRSVPVLVKCWAGCGNREIIRHLQQQGLWSMPTATPQERRRYAQEQAERDARICVLEDYIYALDFLKLRVEPWGDSWIVFCRQQGDIRREIEELRRPKPRATIQPQAMAAKAG